MSRLLCNIILSVIDMFNTARSSPRALQVGLTMLQLEDDNPPLAPPFGPPERERTVMGEHFAEVMQELNAKNDEVASLHAQRSDRDAIIRNAEAHVRSAEEALHFESQQRDVAICMAREVASGQTVVLHQVEQRAESTNGGTGSSR